MDKMTTLTEWKTQEVEKYMNYVARVKEQIAEWKAEYGYKQMVTFVDYQNIGQFWKQLCTYSEEWRKECVEEYVEKHYQKLQAKVEKKIGKIMEIEQTGDNGADYRFFGEDGYCEIRVIAAGGYNIQVAHTRWIFVK